MAARRQDARAQPGIERATAGAIPTEIHRAALHIHRTGVVERQAAESSRAAAGRLAEQAGVIESLDSNKRRGVIEVADKTGRVVDSRNRIALD